MKKLISALCGVALAALLVVPVKASPIAGVTKVMESEFYNATMTPRVSGIFSALEDMYDRVQHEEIVRVEVLNKERIASEERYKVGEFKFVPVYPENEVELIALLTEAEAEGEPELGKRLVIDTIINRMISGDFPNDPYGVILQKGQFESMWNGRHKQVSIPEETKQLVIEELHNTTNADVLFFRTNHYFSNQVPVVNVGHHFFSY